MHGMEIRLFHLARHLGYASVHRVPKPALNLPRRRLVVRAARPPAVLAVLLGRRHDGAQVDLALVLVDVGRHDAAVLAQVHGRGLEVDRVLDVGCLDEAIGRRGAGVRGLSRRFDVFGAHGRVHAVGADEHVGFCGAAIGERRRYQACRSVFFDGGKLRAVDDGDAGLFAGVEEGFLQVVAHDAQGGVGLLGKG